MSVPTRRLQVMALLSAFAIAGCAAKAPPDLSVLPEESAASLLTPKEIVAQFREMIGSEQIPTAMAMVDVTDHTTPAQEQVRQRLSALAREMVDNRYDFRPVDAKSQGDAALVIVKETQGGKNPGPPAFNAMFLIRRDGAWRISPEPTRYDRIRGLTSGQVTSFESLDRWFQYRKADLKLEARDAGK